MPDKKATSYPVAVVPRPEQPAGDPAVEPAPTPGTIQVRVRPDATAQTILCSQTHQRYTREWQTFPATSVLPAIRGDHRIEIKEN